MRALAIAIVLAGAPASLTPAEQALARAIDARLLAAASATGTLEAWCAERGIAPTGTRVVATVVAGKAPELPRSERLRLGIGPGEPLGYRHVRLSCGGVLLSEAENWFVPARLTPAMRRALAESDTPFGTVIRPLIPKRENRRVAGPSEATLFVHEGLVRSAEGVPLAFVRERYQRGLLR